jgi:hypothetical protein
MTERAITVDDDVTIELMEDGDLTAAQSACWSSGDTPTVEARQRLIDRADRDKLGKAQERLKVG